MTAEIVGGILLLLAVSAFALVLAYCALRLAFGSLEILENSMRFGKSIFRFEFLYSDLIVSEIVCVDASGDSSYRRAIRLYLGVSLPGMELGWFNLGNGSDALVRLRSHKQALFIPMNNGKALLLGVDNPQQVLDAIKAKAL